MEASIWKECVASWKTDAHRATLQDEAQKTRELAQEAAANSASAARNASAAAWYAFWG